MASRTGLYDRLRAATTNKRSKARGRDCGRPF